MTDDLGDRMKKNYEDRYRTYLLRRTPAIIRLDGKAFHTLTRSLERPFDQGFADAMDATTEYLATNVQGCIAAYTQSDEISLLLQDFRELNTDAWFDYNIQKLVSVSAAMASVQFSKHFGQDAYFDARCFSIPREEVGNYFRWRAQDCERNSVQMLARSLYFHKELIGVKIPELKEKILDVGHSWPLYPERFKNGFFISRRFEESFVQSLIRPSSIALTTSSLVNIL